MVTRYAIRLTPALAAAGLCALGGCASYTAAPLPRSAELAPRVSLLDGGAQRGGPLTVPDIATLAVLNNPDLCAVRTQRGVAAAQAFQAGLLPNPSVTGAILPLAAGAGRSFAWNAGISENVRDLVTLSTRRRGAQDTAHQVDAQILWQEWQTIGQARLLAVDIIEGEAALRVLRRSFDLLSARDARSQQALAAGNATIATVAPDLAALQAARTQFDDLVRVQLGRRHQLAALLGLTPDADLPLAATPDLPPIDAEAVLRALPTLPERRPDLIALQLGYRAQDEKVRAAILSQFPNMTFGITGGSDNSLVRNVGPQITLDLPVFDRNQGNIAIERATRAQLHAEYAARLATADGQVRAMLTESAVLARQLGRARRDLVLTARIAGQADQAFADGNLDERGYVDLIAARLIKEQEVVSIEQSLLEQQVAIATLIGAGMPAINLPAEGDRS